MVAQAIPTIPVATLKATQKSAALMIPLSPPVHVAIRNIGVRIEIVLSRGIVSIADSTSSMIMPTSQSLPVLEVLHLMVLIHTTASRSLRSPRAQCQDLTLFQ